MLLGLGNNIAHALTSGPSRITSPTRVAADGEVRWHDWTCTLLADSGWGDDPRVSCPRGTVVGTDRPVAVVNDSVRIARETNDTVEWVDAGMWDQVGVTDLGVLAFHHSKGLHHFRTIEDFIAGRGESLLHPLLSDDLRMYATHTKVLLVTTPAHLLEITFDRKDGQPRIDLVEDLEGLGVYCVSAGGDRFGVVTSAREGYILSDEVERIDLDADIADIALGDGFEIVVLVTGDMLVRGDNSFGQLGLPQSRVDDWTRLDLQYPVKRVYAGRFSVLIDVEG